METTMLSPVAQANALVLANAADITARVICEIAGNDISNSIQGETATQERIAMIVCAHMTERLTQMTK